MLAQLLFGDARVALVHAGGGAAVADEVLGAGEDGGPGFRRWGVLKPAHGGGAQQLGQLGRLAEALVGASPALVARHGDAGGERPAAPVPATSRAVTRAAFSTRSGLRVAPRPMLCGKTTAPSTSPSPWTASMP